MSKKQPTETNLTKLNLCFSKIKIKTKNKTLNEERQINKKKEILKSQ